MTFEDFLESRGPSGKASAMTDLVNAIKSVIKSYDVDTRRYVWNKLISEKGKRQMDRLIRSPSAPVSMSDFLKLLE